MDKEREKERENDSLAGIGAHILTLWMVRAIDELRCLPIWLTSLSF